MFGATGGKLPGANVATAGIFGSAGATEGFVAAALKAPTVGGAALGGTPAGLPAGETGGTVCEEIFGGVTEGEPIFGGAMVGGFWSGEAAAAGLCPGATGAVS